MWNGQRPLDVRVTVPEVEVNKVYQIDLHLKHPADELYCPTTIPIIDKCILSIHRQLLENGISFGLHTETYQRLLRQLFLYRYHCGLTPDYINSLVASQSEIQGFHRHLQSKLVAGLDYEALEIVNEQPLGNSRVDMVITGYPVELKLEDRRNANTDEIVRRYESQAADYVARRGSPFGFLLILDTVLDRVQPTATLEQDIKFRNVRTVSGDTVIVIAVVVRIPRPSSDFSALRN